MKLWLDDQLDECAARRTPEGFHGAKSSKEAAALVREFGYPSFMDLDHDLSDGDDALVFLKWLEQEYPNHPPPEFNVHSENPVGRGRISDFIHCWRRSRF